MKKKKMKAAALGAGLLAVAGLAHAGTLSGTGAPASADVTFTSPVSLTNTLTPMTGLKAGPVPNNTRLARGLIHSLNGKAALYEVKFGGVTDNVSYDSNHPVADIPGKNNPANKISVYLNADGSSRSHSTLDAPNFGLILSQSGDALTPARTMPYVIQLWNNQTVPADTYTISTVAYVYNP